MPAAFRKQLNARQARLGDASAVFARWIGVPLSEKRRGDRVIRTRRAHWREPLTSD
jgi:hypothetical protein